jgi:HEAT repeat protein
VYPTEAVEAIRNMGQPAVDALLDRMTAKDPAWKLKLIALAEKQSLIKVDYQTAEIRRGWANSVLCELGPSASNAVPSLVAWLSDDELANPAARVLAHIGRASVGPVLVRLANGDAKVRRQAVQILGGIGPDANQAVPWLVYCLSDTNRALRGTAIRALGGIGEPRYEIEQRLTGLLHRPEDALVAACGLVSMGRNGIPVLTRALTNENPKVRLAGAGGLTFWQDIRRRPVVQTGRDRRDWTQSRSSLFNLIQLAELEVGAGVLTQADMNFLESAEFRL